MRYHDNVCGQYLNSPLNYFIFLQFVVELDRTMLLLNISIVLYAIKVECGVSRTAITAMANVIASFYGGSEPTSKYCAFVTLL